MDVVLEVTGPVSALLAELRQGEGLAFSPGGDRLAVADYGRDIVLVLQVALSLRDGRTVVALTDGYALASAALVFPHDLCWLDDDVLAVASREASVALFRLPRAWPSDHALTLAPFRSLSGHRVEADRHASPGSVTCLDLSGGLRELLVCNTFQNHVSQYLLDVSRDHELLAHAILLRGDLHFPDGVAVSPDHRLLGVGNHFADEVLLYDNDALLAPDSRPRARLVGCGVPHGLVFCRSGRVVLVSDADSPMLHVYVSAQGWQQRHPPSLSLPVVAADDFARCHTAPGEGGVKGLAVDPGERVLAYCSEGGGLGFLALAPLLQAAGSVDVDEPLEPVSDHGALRRALAALERERQDLALAHHAALERVYASRSMRLTSPLRWLGGWWRGLRR